MHHEPSGRWKPGPIAPKTSPRSVTVCVRIPRDLFDALDVYAKRLRSPRSHLIKECLRRMVDAEGLGAPKRAKGRSAAKR